MEYVGFGMVLRGSRNSIEFLGLLMNIWGTDSGVVIWEKLCLFIWYVRWVKFSI